MGHEHLGRLCNVVGAAAHLLHQKGVTGVVGALGAQTRGHPRTQQTSALGLQSAGVLRQLLDRVSNQFILQILQ